MKEYLSKLLFALAVIGIAFPVFAETIPTLPFKTKVSSGDTTAGYLQDKIVAGSNVTVTPSATGSNQTLTISSTGGSGSNSVGSAGYVQFASSTLGAFNGTANLFWDNANTRLGIGTSTPTNTLTVSGTANITGATTLATTSLNGVVSGSGVSQSSSALTLAQRDGNSNIFANNFIFNVNTTVSSGTTTVLTSASARIQILTGTQNQTYQLPNATTMSIGSTFEFNNNSTGVLTITNASSSVIATLISGSYARVTATSTSSVAGAWDKHFLVASNSTWGTNGLGIGTSSPAANLDVYGVTGVTENVASTYGSAIIRGSDISVSSTTRGILDVEMSGTVGGQDRGPTLTFSNNMWQFGTSYTRVGAAIKSGKETASNQSGSSYLSFLTHNGTDVGERMRITSSGNVAIGTTTTNGKLEVLGPTFGFPATSGSTQNALAFRYSNSGSAVSTDFGSFGTNGGWIQVTNPSNLSVTYPLLLNPNGGNVGVGTTTPGAQLETVTSNAARDALRIDYTGGAGGGIWAFNPFISGVANNGLSVIDRTAGASNTRMVINSSGNVGIGTTTPAFTLQVFGSAKFGDAAGGVDIGSSVMRFSGPGPHIYTGGYAQPLKINGSSVLLNPDSGGSVGIGTTTPGAVLDVTNPNASTYIFRMVNSAGNPAFLVDNGQLQAQFYKNGHSDPNQNPGITFINDTNTGINSPGTHILNLITNGSERMRIDASGNVGIGTTTPAWKFNVESSSSNNAGVFQGAGGKAVAIGGSTAAGFIQALANDSSGATTASLALNPTSGNVGIGTTTPLQLLHVYSTTGVGGARIEDANGGFTGSLLSVSEVTRGDTTAYNLITATNQAGSKFIVRGDGTVGIGTSTPTSPLYVEGTNPVVIAGEYNGTFNAAFINYRSLGTPSAKTQVTTDTALGGLGVYGYTGAGYDPSYASGMFRFYAAENQTGLNNQGTYFTIETTPTGSPASSRAERLRVTSDGKVGIGTSTPTATLHVQAAAAVTPFVIASSSNATLVSVNTKGDISTTGAIIKRTVGYASGATLTADWGTTDIATTTVNQTLTIANPTGTAPYDGATFMLVLLATTTQNISFGNQFATSTDTGAFPPSVASGTSLFLFQWNQFTGKLMYTGKNAAFN